jgi:hypothetical protein
MLIVIGPQISRLLRWHHDHLGAMAPEPGGQWHPGIACGLDHNRDVPLSIGEAPPEQLSRRIRASGELGCSAGKSMPTRKAMNTLLGVVSRGCGCHVDRNRHQSFAMRDHHRAERGGDVDRFRKQARVHTGVALPEPETRG